MNSQSLDEDGLYQHKNNKITINRMNQMIKKFQEKTREYLQFQENLDSMTCPIKES